MNRKMTKLMTWAVAALMTTTLSASAGDLGDLVASSSAVGIATKVAHDGATFTVSGPNGFYYRADVAAGQEATMSLFDKAGYALPDGSYSWELRLNPVLSDAVRKQLAEARATGDDSVVADLRKRGVLPTGARTETGTFAISGGALVSDAVVEEGGPSVAAVKAATDSPRAGLKDQVFLDDLIVDGSACIGQDCANGENFGFDTIRLKENNLRIKFDDTSSSGSFPNNDWELTANDSSNGGANRFSIQDVTNNKTPFTVKGNAPTNSIYVKESNGFVGFGNGNPVVGLHHTDGNSPALRLEQDGSSGFASQTWDLAGNETNFFIRDVTNGSKLPFKIIPNAPTNALYVAASGDIGLGTASPGSDLHIRDTAAGDNVDLELESSQAQWVLRSNGTNGNFAFVDQTNGNSPFKIDLGSPDNAIAIDASGAVGIGTNSPNTSAALDVNGAIFQRGTSLHADYVFEDDYVLKSIEEQSRFMWANKHLPSIPKRTVDSDGQEYVEIGSHRQGIVEELEKAHIYIEQLHSAMKAMEARLEALEGETE